MAGWIRSGVLIFRKHFGLVQVQHRVQIVELFWEHQRSVETVHIKFCYLNNRRSECIVGLINENFQKTDSVEDQKVKNEFIVVLHMKILIWFVKMLLKTVKYSLHNLQNELDVVGLHYGAFHIMIQFWRHIRLK